VLSYRLQSADEKFAASHTRALSAFTPKTAPKAFRPTRRTNCGRCSRFSTRCRSLFHVEAADELRSLTVWKVHTLTGDRKGTWRLSVTRNRRLTFTIDDEGEICDLNLEDYH